MTEPEDMGSPVVVFDTASDIEASVVMSLLDSHGIGAFRVSGNPQAIWPMAVTSLGRIQVAVAAPVAEEARRVIDSHREERGQRVVRLPDDLDALERTLGYEFENRRLLEQALTHRSRAAEDTFARRRRQRVAGVPGRRAAGIRGGGLAVPAVSRTTTKGRSRRSRPRWCPRRRWHGTPRRCGSATT